MADRSWADRTSGGRSEELVRREGNGRPVEVRRRRRRSPSTPRDEQPGSADEAASAPLQSLAGIRASITLIVGIAAILLSAGLFFGWGDEVPLAGTARLLVWLGIYAFAIGWLWRRAGVLRSVMTAPPMVLLIVVLVGVVASVSWSFDPLASAGQAVLIAMTTVVGVMLGLARRPAGLIDVLIAAYAILLVAALLATVVVPDLTYARYPIYPEGNYLGWVGLQGNKNLTGSSAAIGCLVFVVALLRGRIDPRLGAALLLGALGALFGTWSVTALISGAVALAMLITFYLAHRAGLPSLVIFILGLITLAVASYLGFLFAGDVTLTFGKEATLTGRTSIWDDAFKMTMRTPWTGYGAGVVWGLGDQSWLQGYETTLEADHAHNGFLDLATQVGFPLALVAVAQVAVTAWAAVVALARKKSSFTYFAVAYVFLFVGHNIAESALFRANYEEWIIYVAICARLSLTGSRAGGQGRPTGARGRHRRQRARRSDTRSGPFEPR